MRVMYKFICDICGKELEHHGERYIVRIEAVPSSYSSKFCTWDLCYECSEKLTGQLNERKSKCDTTICRSSFSAHQG